MKTTLLSICAGLSLLALPLSAAMVQSGVYGTRAVNIFTLGTNVNDGETLTIKGIVFEADLNPSNRLEVTTRQRIDLGTNGLSATNRVIFTNNVDNGDTLTIAGKTYVFVTSMTNATANLVWKGASTAETVTNLAAAINLSGGTNYSSATAISTNFFASALNTTQVTVRSRSPGKEGNSFAITLSSGNTNYYVPAAAFSAGAGPNPASDLWLTTNIVRAINQYYSSNIIAFGVSASVLDTNQILLTSRNIGENGATNGETFAGASFAAAGMYGGVQPEPIAPSTAISRVPKTDEVTQDQLHVVCGFTPRVVLVNVVTTSSGARIAWDGAVIISGNRVTIDNSGSVDWATTSTLYVIASP